MTKCNVNVNVIMKMEKTILVLCNWYWTTKSPFTFIRYIIEKHDAKVLIDWYWPKNIIRNKAKCGGPDKQSLRAEERSMWDGFTQEKLQLPGKGLQGLAIRGQIYVFKLSITCTAGPLGLTWALGGRTMEKVPGHLNFVTMDQPSVKCIYESVTTYNVPMEK